MAHDPFAGTYTTHCLTTGERLTLESGPTLADHKAGSWSYLCPVCGESHRTVYGPRDSAEFLERLETIDLPIDINLGELITGQHIVLRGITLRTPWGSVLRYSFVPGFSDRPRTIDASWGLGTVNDDIGTVYDHQGQGGWGPDSDGIVRQGDEDLGNGIPPSASWLTIEFRPVHYSGASGRWISKIMVDLALGSIIGICDTGG